MKFQKNLNSTKPGITNVERDLISEMESAESEDKWNYSQPNEASPEVSDKTNKDRHV